MGESEIQVDTSLQSLLPSLPMRHLISEMHVHYKAEVKAQSVRSHALWFSRAGVCSEAEEAASICDLRRGRVSGPCTCSLYELGIWPAQP